MTRAVSIVMLTCNNLRKAQKCLTSWLPAAAEEIVTEWLILDNASTDGTASWLNDFAARNDKIRVIQSPTNLGCSGGRAQLFQQATGDLIFSLDSDVRLLNRRAVYALARELDNPSVGLVGDHGGGVNKNWTWTVSARPDYEGELPIVSGYCQMFRRSALQHVALDQAYNPYWLEDADFCFQLRVKLGQTSVVRHSGMRHVWSGTNKGGSVEQEQKWRYFRNKWQPVLGDSVICRGPCAPPPPLPKKSPPPRHRP